MFGLRFRTMKRRSHTDDFFSGAVKAYALKGDEAAALAIFVMATQTSTTQRAEMVARLRILAGEIETDASAGGRVAVSRLDALASKIGAENWDRTGVVTAKRNLRALAPDYYEALSRNDAGILLRQYPDLSGDCGMDSAELKEED
jgi:hypothetical protein